jgi:hypothetical protein
MGNKMSKTKREIEFYADKVIAEQQVFKLQLHLAALNQVLKENTLVPIEQKNKTC